MLSCPAAAELAQQVGRVVRALSQGGLRVRSAIMTGGQQDEDRRHKTFRTQVGVCWWAGVGCRE
jgi:superfamily II DNA/RNA helicase